MKSLLLFIVLYLANFVVSTTPSITESGVFLEKKIPSVEKLETAPNLYKSENLFFSGQPSLETLDWLKEQGVDLIISLRSEEENDKFANSAFNEKNISNKMGMRYISIPISGYDSYNKENLAKLAEALDSKYNKVLIHCASCGRVTYFMMAYLIQYKAYQLSEAIEFGKQLKFKFPLEDLLNEENFWKTK